MKSTSCITRSDSLVRLFGPGLIAACLAAILAGCGGSSPPLPGNEPLPATGAEAGHARNSGSGGSTANDNGTGNLTFHYANKSTDANLLVDLSATDVYLEMSGKPMPAGGSSTAGQAEAARAADLPREPGEKPASRGNPAPRESQDAAGQDAPAAAPPPRDKDAQSRAKPEKSRDRIPPEEEEQPQGYAGEDVTSRVLSGIRKAQEFFYQKRYPEALQMVRQSLDLQPTAEGHALAGSIHYMLGQNGLARRNWQEALRINPDMPSVVRMLERTSTPGGRGSPYPRPVAPRAIPRPMAGGRTAQMPPAPDAEQAPFPEVQDGFSEAGMAPANPPARANPAAHGNPDPGSRPPPSAPQAGPETAPEAPLAPASAPAVAPTVAPAPVPATAPAKPSGKPAPIPAKPPGKPTLPPAPAPVKPAEKPAPSASPAPAQAQKPPKGPPPDTSATQRKFRGIKK